MATYYASATTGNNANAGTSPGAAKATIQAAVNLATAAGDTVKVAPGTYRETVTCGYSGSVGNPITIEGDYTGATFGMRRDVVRITGSNDDITATRSSGITATTKSYLTIRGFALDLHTVASVYMVTCSNIIVEHCYSQQEAVSVYFNGDCSSNTVRRIVAENMIRGSAYCIMFADFATARDNTANIVELCRISSGSVAAIYILRHGGVTVRNCDMIDCARGLYVLTLTAGQTTTINNCILLSCGTALQANTLGEITEDYNTLWGNLTARTNVSSGANSITRPPLFDTRWFFEAVNGQRVLTPFDLASYSTLVEYNSGTGAPSTDLRGYTVRGTYREWGAVEYDSALSVGGVRQHPGMGGGINA